PSCGWVGQRIEIERGLLVRMRRAQRAYHLRLVLDRVDGLEPQLRDALLLPALSDRRRRRRASEEGSRALGIPRAALVVADPPSPGCENSVAHRVERVGGDEDDELAPHGRHRIAPGMFGVLAQ